QSRRSGDVDPKHLRRVVRKFPVVAGLRQMRHRIDAARQIARWGCAFQIPENIRSGGCPRRALPPDAKYIVPLLDKLGHKSPADKTTSAGKENPHATRQLSGLLRRTEMPFGLASLNWYSRTPSSASQPLTSSSVCCQASC